MTYDMFVLRALVRLARTSGSRGRQADAEMLAFRAGGSAAQVRAALRRLEHCGLARRDARGTPHLTLEGLTVVVAAAAKSRRRPDARRPAESRAAA